MSAPTGPLLQLSQAVREGRLSAQRLTQASIDRLQRAANLNVLAERCFDEALSEARRVDDGEGHGGRCSPYPR